MIVLVRRADLSERYKDMEAEKVHLHHLDLDTDILNKADLVVFMENNRIQVLRGKNWPYGKRMAATDLLKHIADHAS